MSYAPTPPPLTESNAPTLVEGLLIAGGLLILLAFIAIVVGFVKKCCEQKIPASAATATAVELTSPTQTVDHTQIWRSVANTDTLTNQHMYYMAPVPNTAWTNGSPFAVAQQQPLGETQTIYYPTNTGPAPTYSYSPWP